VTAGRRPGTAGALRTFVAAFILALVGSLGVFASGFSLLQLGAAVLVGAITSLVGHDPRILLGGLIAGAVAAYAAALGLGIFAYLAENWVVFLLLYLALASVGFGVGRRLRGAASSRAL